MFENTYAHTSAAEVFHILYVYMIDNSSHDMFNATAVIAWGERTQFQNLRCAFNSVQNHRSVQEHADGHAIEISSTLRTKVSQDSTEVARQQVLIRVDRIV